MRDLKTDLEEWHSDLIHGTRSTDWFYLAGDYIERAIEAEQELDAYIEESLKSFNTIGLLLKSKETENAALCEKNAKLLAVVEVAKELYYMGTNFGNYENGNTCMGIDEGKVMAGKVFGKFEKVLAELEGAK